MRFVIAFMLSLAPNVIGAIQCRNILLFIDFIKLLILQKVRFSIFRLNIYHTQQCSKEKNYQFAIEIHVISMVNV